ncbi:hypothetical protein TL16_g05021, partial [Triparma laevis f. inornata]
LHADVLSLESIRSTLIRQEETIIFALIERSQFSYNAPIYSSSSPLSQNSLPLGARVPEDVESLLPLSFLEYMLLGTELLHGSVRRYTSPDEHSFFPTLIPEPLSTLKPLTYPPELLSPVGNANLVNFNSVLLKRYINEVIPLITLPGDDDQYGSSVLTDTLILQSLSKRIHYGKFVAESKYLSDPEGYQRMCGEGDVEGVMRLLTNEIVEEKVLKRSKIKAATYGREPLSDAIPVGKERSKDSEIRDIVAAAAAAAANAAVDIMGDGYAGMKLKPSVVEGLYRDLIIPLTKEIEVEYLFRRTGFECPDRKKEIWGLK